MSGGSKLNLPRSTYLGLWEWRETEKSLRVDGTSSRGDQSKDLSSCECAGQRWVQQELLDRMHQPAFAQAANAEVTRSRAAALDSE